jgi:hypothetical protein
MEATMELVMEVDMALNSISNSIDFNLLQVVTRMGFLPAKP